MYSQSRTRHREHQVKTLVMLLMLHWLWWLMQFYCDRQHLLHLPTSNGVELVAVCLSALLFWSCEPGSAGWTVVSYCGDVTTSVLLCEWVLATGVDDDVAMAVLSGSVVAADVRVGDWLTVVVGVVLWYGVVRSKFGVLLRSAKSSSRRHSTSRLQASDRTEKECYIRYLDCYHRAFSFFTYLQIHACMKCHFIDVHLKNVSPLSYL